MDESREEAGDASLALRHALGDPAERDKNMLMQLGDTNKAIVFIIIALAMAMMANTNMFSSPCSVGDPEPGGEGPYEGSRA